MVQLNKQRGVIELGLPVIVIAVVALVALSRFWAQLGLPLRVVGIAVTAGLTVGGFFLMSRPQGMGARRAAEEARRERAGEDSDAVDDD